MPPTAKTPETAQAAPATRPPKKPRATKTTATAPASAPALDAAISDLHTGAIAWSHLTLDQRSRLLERVRATVGAVAEEWADVAAVSKGLAPGHPLRGEEWLSGPYATITALDAYRRSLGKLAQGAGPLDGVRTSAAPGGRLRAHAFPLDPLDGLLLSGYSGEVWFEPGVTDAEARRSAGLAQLHPTTPGGVGLVLGAGNVASIPVLDVFYELLAHNRTALLKVNPTQDALVPVFERALAPLIEPGFVRITTGDGAVGAYLTQHPGIDHVHITGAAPTFDAIVWGVGDAAVERRRTGTPQLRTPITAELGGVSPIIVVPGEWTEADLRFHAEHVTTMRLYNSGHNCIAGQVVILSSEWPQRDAFLRELERAYDAAPRRPVWYPKSGEKLADAAAAYPSARWGADGTRAIVELEPGDDATALETTEYFAPVLGVVELPGNGQLFLDAAVAYSNDRLAGTLGANLLIDPVTEDALGGGFERAIAALRYGAISINSWTAFAFLTPNLTWGGYPGGTREDVQSGIGIVHNALLLSRVERSITRGPFRPFPRNVPTVLRSRSLSKGSVLPKPPWFVTSRTGAAVSEGLTRFRIDGNWAKLVATFARAFRA